MRIRLLWVALALLLVPAIARADGHRAGLFGAYSVAQGSVLQGAHVNFDYAGKNHEHKSLSAMVDYSVHAKRRQTFMGGLSLSHRAEQFVVEGHALGGRVWGDGTADWAGTLGLAVEWIGSPNAARMNGIHVGPRVQTDVIRRSGAESFWRVSTGLVVRFPKG